MFCSHVTEEDVLRRAAQSFARSKRHRHQFFAIVSLKLECNAAHLAQSIESAIRIEDTAIQVGDKSIILLLEGHRHVSDPLRVVRRLLELLPGTLSRAGIAGGLAHHPNAQHMLEQSHLALKLTTADQPIVFANVALQQEAEFRLNFENDLTTAVHQGRLEPYFQPIITLDNGTVCGFEALVRWQHPTEGLLFPEDFLGIAKDCGLLADLDRFILKASLQQLHHWQALTPQELRVNVNLCPDHFLKEEGLQALTSLMAEHRTSADLLRIDISEEILRHEQGIQALYTLHGLQVGFHLDDFGVSPESFRCLHSFPFDSLKIDRTLIAEMEDEVNAELIAALLRIAHRMNIRTTAEGLVTHAQLEELRQLGCHEAQGFLISPAIDAASTLSFLATNPHW